MQRITIHEIDEFGDRTNLGWFDLDATTEHVVEGERWDGNNMRGVISRLQLGRAELYRTKGGRWVQHEDASREFNGPNRWTFLSPDEARDWLIRSQATEADELVEKYWPETPEEVGPDPKGGRPAIGPTINVAFQRDLLDRIDETAKNAELSRAAWLRKVAEDATSQPTATRIDAPALKALQLVAQFVLTYADDIDSDTQFAAEHVRVKHPEATQEAILQARSTADELRKELDAVIDALRGAGIDTT